jgi:hypothetical protein
MLFKFNHVIHEIWWLFIILCLLFGCYRVCMIKFTENFKMVKISQLQVFALKKTTALKQTDV